MARDGSGNYTLPANTQAVSGDPISSTKYNTLVQDLEADANVDRPVAAGGTGASTALAARANLGLEIGTDVQAYDAGLLSIAGLTTVADRSIYTTASDTYAVYTLTAAGRAILDDADAAAQRTTLGLGTAAVVNTGTSGGTVPLLNAANTWSAAQAFAGNNIVNGTAGTNRQWLYQSAGVNRWAYGMDTGDDFIFGRFDTGGAFQEIVLSFDDTTGAGTFSDTPTVAGSTVWHAGNDGAGSGLDADTLDGVEGSAYARTSGGTITGTLQVTGQTNPASGSGIELLYTGSVGFVEAYNWTSSAWLPIVVAGSTCELWANGSARLSISSAGAVTIANTLQARTAATSETTGTLTVASANKTIQATGDITIPNAVFAAGDIILIYAGASARTITEGASVTMRLGGTATTGSRTLAARGVAMLFFVSASEVIVSGGAVT